MKIAYKAVLGPGEISGCFVYFPDLKEAFSEGVPETEAMFNAEEVLIETETALGQAPCSR